MTRRKRREPPKWFATDEGRQFLKDRPGGQKLSSEEYCLVYLQGRDPWLSHSVLAEHWGLKPAQVCRIRRCTMKPGLKKRMAKILGPNLVPIDIYSSFSKNPEFRVQSVERMKARQTTQPISREQANELLSKLRVD